MARGEKGCSIWFDAKASSGYEDESCVATTGDVGETCRATVECHAADASSVGAHKSNSGRGWDTQILAHAVGKIVTNSAEERRKGKGTEEWSEYC
jgi:hypothetical protein